MATKAAIKAGEQLPKKRKKLDVTASVQNAATGANITVANGLEVVHEDRLKRIVAVTQESCILEDKVTGALSTASHGDYELPQPPSSEARLLTETSMAAKERAHRIHRVLGPYARLPRSLTAQELQEACAAVGLRERATRRYIRRLKVQDTWRSCLIGRPGSKTGGRRIKGERLFIFDTVATRELKRKEGITEEHIINAVNDALIEAGLRTMSHTTIRKYIRGTGTDLRLRHRLSGKAELEAITPVGAGEMASRPLEKVQIDSTRADVNHPRKPRRRPRIVWDHRGLPAKRISAKRAGRHFGLLMHWVRRNGICVLTEGGKPTHVLLKPDTNPILTRLIYATVAVAAARKRNPGGVFTLADEVFGTRARTDLWMAQEIPRLAGKRPVEALATATGPEKVLNILHQIQHGIIA